MRKKRVIVVIAWLLLIISLYRFYAKAHIFGLYDLLTVALCVAAIFVSSKISLRAPDTSDNGNKGD